MSNSSRIFKNSFLLNIRMILVMAVSLYTARVTLDVLGLIDYGIFNVVAGIIGFLSILNGAMVSASQRFLSFELGKNDIKEFNKIFNTLFFIFIIISVFAIIIGVLSKDWVIDKFLVIPEDKKESARVIYLFSLIAFSINITSIPYMSSIVAHEKMNIYGYVGILEAILKLVIVYLLVVISYDKLVLYAFLNVAVTIIITIVFRIYCIKKFQGCSLKFVFEKSLFSKLLNYMGWNLFGSLTGILNIQGQSILLNIFFGPAVNGAKAIADRIYSIISSFSSNIFMSVRPQIIKKYANGEQNYMFELVMSSTKFAYFVVFLLIIPIILNVDFLLIFWLGSSKINSDVILFSRLILIYSLINVFEQPITAMIQATGKIRIYQISVGLVTLSFIPILYLLFKMGYPAYVSVIALILIYILALVIRLLVAKKQINFPIMEYIKKCIIPIAVVTIIAVPISLFINNQIFNSNFLYLLLKMIIVFVLTAFIIYFFGINKAQKVWLFELISKYRSKLKGV